MSEQSTDSETIDASDHEPTDAIVGHGLVCPACGERSVAIKTPKPVNTVFPYDPQLGRFDFKVICRSDGCSFMQHRKIATHMVPVPESIDNLRYSRSKSVVNDAISYERTGASEPGVSVLWHRIEELENKISELE